MAKRMKIDLQYQRRNCSPLNALFIGVCTLISHGVPLQRGRQTGGKTSSFRAKCVNISKMVRDTSKVTIVANRKVHMLFRLATRSITLDHLELYKFEFSENFSEICRFQTQQQLNE